MTQDIESQKQRLILSLRTENAKNMRPMTVMIILVKKKKKIEPNAPIKIL